MARVAIYCRVSTDRQTTLNQRQELEAWAGRAGHEVVQVYEDYASGSKGKDQRPGFAAMLKACIRREHDLVAVWSTDRLGRSMPHLIEVLHTLRATGVDLYIHTQALDTSTPSGRALFQLLGVFAELEREMIVARVNAGLARARQQGKRLGRPALPSSSLDLARDALRRGLSVRQTADLAGISRGSVGTLRQELAAAGELAAA